MKTLELKLKKDVLIVDGNNCAYISDTSLVILGGVIYNFPEDYEFICKGSELTEEIASELVEQSYSNLEESIMYRDYRAKYDDEVLYEALKSFKSAIESKGFYWLENPISLERVISYESVGDTFKSNGIKKVWQEAEEKTFKNPLIFVKK